MNHDGMVVVMVMVMLRVIVTDWRGEPHVVHVEYFLLMLLWHLVFCLYWCPVCFFF